MLTDVLGAVPPAPTFKRLESVWIGKDNALLDAMFEFYAPSAKRVIDVCCNARRMWKGSTTGAKVAYNYFNIKLDVLDVKVENSLAVRQRLIGRES